MLRALLVVGATLVIMGVGLMTVASAGEKVTICHETGSESNPTVLITVDRHAWENGHSIHNRHHGDHLGPPCSEETPTPTLCADDEERLQDGSCQVVYPPEDFPPKDTPTVTPVGSSVDQAPTPVPSVPVAFPSSGGAPK
ncbi:hypothetical protein LCGC14_2670990 [marine sediment metagenome]|uniref:Uncharacterized protein n=1 Tax=marine sediment metagenome TaxID=412755 RepID=A0A0F9CG16_9ZZZZ